MVSKPVTIPKLNVIENSLNSWLNLEYFLNRDGLLSERYIAYALGSLLSVYSSDGFVAEYKSKEFRGSSSPRIDFVSFAGNGEERKINLAIETKWLGKSLPTLGSIIRDVARLSVISAQYEESACFFILAGKRKKLIKFFEENESTLGNFGIYKTYKGADTNSTVNVESIIKSLIDKAFSGKRYLADLPDSITISGRNRNFDSSDFPYLVYAWRVKANTARMRVDEPALTLNRIPVSLIENQ